MEYILTTSYIRTKETMDHQGVRIAEHLAEMPIPAWVSFRWEEPCGVTLISTDPLNPIHIAVLERHYGATVIPL